MSYTLQELEAIMELAYKLPYENHILRLGHASRFGHILSLKKEGELVAYAEVYVLDRIPTHPVIPLPVNVLGGKYLYCYAAVCKRNHIRELIKLGKRTFPQCEFIVYHRLKRNNQLKIERNEYAKSI